MAKYQYPADIDTMASDNGHVVMTCKQGGYGVTILSTDQGADVRVDWGNPTALQQRACLEQAVILGWA